MTFDLKAMATCRSEGTVASLVTKLHTKANDTLCVCSIKDGTALLTAHDASLVKIWSTEDGSLVHDVQTPVQGCASCVCASPITEHNFMVSVDDTVLVYDHRDLLTPAHQFNFNQEEVNEIDVHPKGNFLSSCDDGGDIKVIDVGNAKLFKTLSRQHSNICSTVKFHPRKPWELISGGLDCNLVRWDFNRGRALSHISVSDEECSKQFGMYTINPPMVHSIDTLNSSVVCGLGNGSVAVYGLQGKSLIPKCSAALHSASVAHVCCAELSKGKSSQRSLIISGGNDEKIVVSELREEVDKETTETVRKGKKRVPSETQLRVLLRIDHGSKVNWIGSYSLKDSSSSLCRIYVADQTQYVSVYEVKER